MPARAEVVVEVPEEGRDGPAYHVAGVRTPRSPTTLDWELGFGLGPPIPPRPWTGDWGSGWDPPPSRDPRLKTVVRVGNPNPRPQTTLNWRLGFGLGPSTLTTLDWELGVPVGTLHPPYDPRLGTGVRVGTPKPPTILDWGVGSGWGPEVLGLGSSWTDFSLTLGPDSGVGS